VAFATADLLARIDGLGVQFIPQTVTAANHQ
jgi:hypothetical protein